MLLNDHGSVSPVVPTEGLRGQLVWWSLALHRQPTGPRTQLGTPPTPGARMRPCGATRPRGSGEALPFHRGPQAQGKRCPSTGGPQAQGRPYPSTGNHALTWRPYPSTRGPWAHTDARHVHRGNPGFTRRPRRPLPAPGPPHAIPLLFPRRPPLSSGLRGRRDSGAQRPSASSFKLTAIKRPGSTNQVSRRRSKEPIVAELRRGRGCLGAQSAKGSGNRG